MLYTTDKQKELLRKIVEDYDDYGKIGNKYILRMVLDVTNNAALEWNVDDSVTNLYNDDPNKMLDFIGCIGLIDYLLKNNLIYIHSSRRNLSADKHVVATNAATIEQVIELIGIDNAKSLGENKYFYKKSNGIFSILTNKSILRTDLCKKVDFFGDSLVYPMPYLVEYVEKGFKTEEELRFDSQMNDTQNKHAQAMDTAKRTLRWTRMAFFIAFVAAMFPMISETLDLLAKKDMTIRELNDSMKSLYTHFESAQIQSDTLKQRFDDKENVSKAAQ